MAKMAFYEANPNEKTTILNCNFKCVFDAHVTCAITEFILLSFQGQPFPETY